MSMMIGTDCTGSCKSNYHTITTTTVPYEKGIATGSKQTIQQKIPNILWQSIIILHISSIIYNYFK